jgi:hypothetical protein
VRIFATMTYSEDNLTITLRFDRKPRVRKQKKEKEAVSIPYTFVPEMPAYSEYMDKCVAVWEAKWKAEREQKVNG